MVGNSGFADPQITIFGIEGSISNQCKIKGSNQYRSQNRNELYDWFDVSTTTIPNNAVANEAQSSCVWKVVILRKLHHVRQPKANAAITKKHGFQRSMLFCIL